jgi:ferredoxin
MAEAMADKWMVELVGGGESFACRSDQNLLAAMISARQTGIKVGCRNGGCGVCRVQVSSGRFASQKMTRSRISEADEVAGIVLACRISPLSDLDVAPLPLSPGKAVA